MKVRSSTIFQIILAFYFHRGFLNTVKIKNVNKKPKPPLWWLLPKPIKKLSRLGQLNKHNHRNTKDRRALAARMDSNEL
jgi:hypothetical protein